MNEVVHVYPGLVCVSEHWKYAHDPYVKASGQSQSHGNEPWFLRNTKRRHNQHVKIRDRENK